MTTIRGGKFYRPTSDGDLVEIADPGVTPDVWICRRVADFPDGRRPDGAAQATCVRCGEAIAYQPRPSWAVPKICFQCAGIRPAEEGGRRR